MDQTFSEFKYSVQNTREEALDSDDCDGWHLRLEREEKGVVGLALDQVFEQSQFLPLISVRLFGIQMSVLMIRPLNEVFSECIEQHEYDFLARLAILVCHLAVVS